MENTTATTLDGFYAQQDAGQLIDRNAWEYVIAHELFHQWFGDYVTTESWSNLTLNESFADFSETLWYEYKYGKDAGDEMNYLGMQGYLSSGVGHLDLVRFFYKDKIEMFDAVSYSKGGRVLNMLRNFVGDSAFFKSVNVFLTTKKFQSAEAHDLRLAFEEVTGQDLNWFWNQWYFGSGHPILDIVYDYDTLAKTTKVIIKQTQPDKVFTFPIAVDVYQGAEKKRYNVWVDQASDTLSFTTDSKPDLINVDGEKILLCEKTDNKTLDNFIFQYHNAGLYFDRREAITYAARKQNKDPKALALLKTAMTDKYKGIRIYAIRKLNISNDTVKNAVEPLLVNLANNDSKSTVRAEAIKALGNYKKDMYKDFFLSSIKDSSYSIAANALLALGAIDSVAGFEQLKILSSQNAKGVLADAINEFQYMYENESLFDSLAARFDNLPFGGEKFPILRYFANFLKRVNNTTNFKKGIDMIVNFRDSIPEVYRAGYSFYINGTILEPIATGKQSLGMTEHADYITSKLPAKPTVETTFEVPLVTLQKYIGEYVFSRSENIKLVLKDDKTLNLIFPDRPVWELTPLSKNKFSVKNINGNIIEFIMNEKNEVSEILLTSPNWHDKATKYK